MSFYNICGGLKFTVGTSGIKKVIISGNSGEEIAGKIKVKFDSNDKPSITEITEGMTNVTLSSTDGLVVGSIYYVTILPTIFSDGLTIRLETDNMYAEKVYEGNREIKRSVWGNLSQVDDNLKWYQKELNPLTFTSTGNTTISLVKNGTPADIKLQYKKNKALFHFLTDFVGHLRITAKKG